MFQKMLNRFNAYKTLLILVLTVLALYQTGQLWFVNMTNRNFFYTYFASIVNPVVPDAHSDIVCPYRIISGAGDGKFAIHYSSLQNMGAKAYGETVLSALFKNGEYVSLQTADYRELLNRPLYIYEYAFPMTAEIFARAYAQKASFLTSRGISFFTGFIIQPPTLNDAFTHVFFLSDGMAHHFVISKGIETQEPPPIERQDDSIYYVSAALEGLNNVSPAAFIARWEGGDVPFLPVTVTNPYANTYGEKLLSYIQTRVEAFFDSPTALNADAGEGGIYTFSSVNTVVRYHDRDILEYASYRPIDLNNTTDFMEDYSAAVSFINKDMYIVNETYLSGFTQEGDQHIFYFDYVINDMPLVLPNGWPSNAENGHPLEVVVDHGSVVKYKKLVYNFHIDESVTRRGRLDFYGLLDNFTDIEGAEPQDILIKEALLGYRIDNVNALLLYWFVETGSGQTIKYIGA